MKNTHAGVSVKRRIAGLRPLLSAWTDLLTVYHRAQPDDLAYWYNERATLSVLAAAAWKAGGIALEEYASIKRKGSSRQTGNGRADLWVRRGSLELAVEAKQAFVTIRGMQRRDAVEGALRDACDDARALLGNAAPLRAGVAFIVPDVAPRHLRSFAWIEALLHARSTPHDFAAWWFLDKEWPKAEKTPASFPGVVLLGRFVPGAR